MSQLLEYLVENEPAFRKARLPALYSDFQSQRTLNPDGYQANVSAWRRALARIARSGQAPSPRGASPSLLVLQCDEPLLRALESKQYGRPLALPAVVQEALAAHDLVPLRDFLTSQTSIYQRGEGRSWPSVWGVAAWTMRQIGVADLLSWKKGDALPAEQFVVVANVEEMGKRFGEKSGADAGTRLQRTFSKAHFYKTFSDQLADEGRQLHLSETDVDVLLTFLARDKGVILYDGKTVKILSPGAAEQETASALTEEDASIAQLKELLAHLTHQTDLLSKRVEELAAAAKDAVTKKNRIAALAALKSKKLAEATLEKRFATVSQLEEVAAKIEQAADNVQLVKVMASSTEALRSLHAQVGGVEGVEDVVERLREQTEAADEVNTILAESGAVATMADEDEIDDELAALEGEEKRKLEEIERKNAEAEKARKDTEEAKEAEETKKRLEAIEQFAARTQQEMDEKEKQKMEMEKEKEKEKEKEEAEELLAESMLSRMSLDERERSPEMQPAV
ncbi:Snf7-domain-containing protein [Podospora didyma]|uniref:Snf7-domain-containing protein n=1 Tax=Podospora didyma TaxID=330526 RepID=A0AAE0U523_9PEZI|nr:Snf7-domain-containing protein [Podospora didyma]